MATNRLARILREWDQREQHTHPRTRQLRLFVILTAIYELAVHDVEFSDALWNENQHWLFNELLGMGNES